MAQTNDPYEGSLDRSAARGVQTITYPVPTSGPNEICVIPQHLPAANYRGKDGEKDLADEKRLASYDFYKMGIRRTMEPWPFVRKVKAQAQQ